MAKSKIRTTNSAQSNSPDRHLAEELEEQFHVLQGKLAKARETYLTYHKNEVRLAREKMHHVQGKLAKARKKVARAAIEAKNSGAGAACSQLKKARAASLLLTESLKEAKEMMVAAQSRLHTAKPLDRKLAARTRAITQFEKDWNKKMHEEAASKTARAKKAAARRRTNAKKRAAKKFARNNPGNGK